MAEQIALEQGAHKISVATKYIIDYVMLFDYWQLVGSCTYKLPKKEVYSMLEAMHALVYQPLPLPQTKEVHSILEAMHDLVCRPLPLPQAPPCRSCTPRYPPVTASTWASPGNQSTQATHL
jgi:hypothetical protein